MVVRDPGRTGATFTGHDELVRFWREWLESWDEYRVEPTEVIVKHDENYVAPSGSGIPSQVIDPGTGT